MMLFASFGGRKFDDSPKSIYDEICSRDEFNDYELVWCFADPSIYNIPRGKKIKIDSFQFINYMIKARVWISNSGLDRGLNLHFKNKIRIETWHGTPLKKICGEENTNPHVSKNKKIDRSTIRCAQSNYDREIFARVFNASLDSFLLCDLPRNDYLVNFNEKDISKIKKQLNIENKKVILYAPTYREYLLNDDNENFISPPVNFEKWHKQLGNDYVILVRAHYAITASLKLKNDGFIKDVSNYNSLNELMLIADILISDYSSIFVDFSILNKPMLCFPYDYSEYIKKRGLYLKLEEIFDNELFFNENDIINELKNLDVQKKIKQSIKINKMFSPNAGHASKTIVDILHNKLL